jgi:hypothetical protein
MVVGDFNFREMGEPVEDTNLLDSGYVDVWVEIQKEKCVLLSFLLLLFALIFRNTVTYDITNNLIAKLTSESATKRTGRLGRSFRYDRYQFLLSMSFYYS